MRIEPIVLTGERAELRPLAWEHELGLLEAAQHPDIWHYMPTPLHEASAMHAWIESSLKAQEAGLELPFTIFDRAEGRIVGSTRFMDITLPNRGLEIGWTWLNPSVWRTRVNTECKLLLLTHCFEVLHLLRVQLKTDLRNMRSQTAIARIGGVKEGVLRKHRILPDGYVRDSVYFSILDEEWQTVKANLEAALRS
jgi:RimJ/RimL family protein N-acetyltransferase